MRGIFIATHCSNCGKEVPSQAKFCPECGEKLTRKRQSKKVTQGINRKSLWALVITFIVSLLVALLIMEGNRRHLQNKLAATGKKEQLPPNHPDLSKMETIQKLRQTLEQNPNDFNIIVQLANTYFDVGDFVSSIPLYKKASRLRSTVPEILIDLGVAYFNLNKLDSAMIYIDQGLALDAKHKLGLLNKGVIQFNMGKFRQAIESWRKIIEFYPQSREAKLAQDYIEQAKQRLN